MLRNNRDSDEFTPPDFIENLLKKNISSTSIGSDIKHSLYDNVSSRKNMVSPIYRKRQPLVTSSPQIPLKISKNVENMNCQQKLSIYDNQNLKIWMTKFKIFFKTSLNQYNHNQKQLLETWARFESSFENPFKFDRLIQDLRNKKKQNASPCKCKKQILQQSTKVHQKNISKSLNKSLQIHKKSLSIPKKNQLNVSREDMHKQSIYLKKIMTHGHNFIKNKNK